MPEKKKINTEQTVEIAKGEISTVRRRVKARPSNLTIINGVLWTFITIAVVFVLFFTILLVNLLATTPKLDVSKFDNLQSSQIYDRNNELVADVGKTLRENVTYDDLPSSLVDAFVACEDSRFFSHNGFDISRFTKASAENVLRKLHLGGSAAGGSTITMQLVKNTYFTDDETGTTASRSGLAGIKRKFQEIKLAIELEDKISKEQILELYVNKLNYGANGRGIQNAANYYFDKDVQDLTISESALLVGTINSPTYYNPFLYLDNATDRRNNVLYLMYYHGYITAEEYNLAKSINVEDQLADPFVSRNGKGEGNPYQAYIDAVINEVTETTGTSPYSVSMKIYTSMSKGVQEAIDGIEAGETGGVFEWPDELLEVASVAIDNDTGEILGILGGRNYSKGGTLLLNHATQQKKQPGSSIKPLLEYALAFDKLGWATSHYLTDAPYNYVGTNFVVSNYDSKYRGEVTIQQALSWSLNSPALQTMQELMYNEDVGIEGIVEYMNKMGYDQVNTSNFDVQYAIGGATLEVTVVQQAAAQAAIINGGVYHKPHTVRKIEYIDGSDPYIPTYDGVQTLSEEAAYMVADCLAKNVRESHSYSYPNIRSSKYTVYGKSGTSNWGSEAAQYNIPVGSGKDSWINASNVDYTVCTWVGYEKAIKDQDTYMSLAKRSFDYQGKTTKLIFNALDEFMGVPDYTLKQPAGVVGITHLAGTNVSGNKNYPYVSVDGIPETVTVEDSEVQLHANGLIKKANYSLIAAEDLKESAAILEDLKNFTVDQQGKDGDGNITFKLTWDKYPNQDKFTKASKTMNLEIINNTKEETSATGDRAFDWSWVYGSVVYKADVSVNGEVVDTVISSGYDNNTSTYTRKLADGDEVTIIGYYAFENSGIASNKVKSKTFSIKEEPITVKYNKNDFEALISNYSLKVEREYTLDDNVYTVTKNGSKVTVASEQLTPSSLRKSDIRVKMTTPYKSSDVATIDSSTGLITGCNNDKVPSSDGKACEAVKINHLIYKWNNNSKTVEVKALPGQMEVSIIVPDGCPSDMIWKLEGAKENNTGYAITKYAASAIPGVENLSTKITVSGDITLVPYESN